MVNSVVQNNFSVFSICGIVCIFHKCNYVITNKEIDSYMYNDAIVFINIYVHQLLILDICKL